MRRLLWPVVQLALALGVVSLLLQWVLRLFGRRRTVFQVTYWRGVYLLIWPLASLCVALPLLRPLLTGPRSWWEIMLLALLFAVVLGFAAPSLLLHGQYYRRNRRTTLLFDPRQNTLEVYEGAEPVPFARHDIERVEYCRCRARRAFWSNYEFLRLHLRDGRTVELTSLLADLGPLAEFLRNTRLQPVWRWVCRL
ncbi:hypothetical protein LJ737_00635 [Hymenobacter sp. 15J16-1T3B]|uniref:hypothetical protein n=1 Tax=Hymenobacter sp. 15J16-1T3B TaxID=2886941 RepID=UPI001D127F68|nr:hypothetical protein [Hymenobacter sp. 15J16-1T3B]MCC3155723.1 hypothetical protein [Hymenobacter sp. 15J16-1T3B]